MRSERLLTSEQFNYTAQILFVLILYLSKVSLLFFIIRLTPSKETLQACWVVMGVVTGWAISIVIALAAQCSLPRPYDFSDPTKCVNQRALYYAAGIIDIATDLTIVILPCVIVWNVQITRRQRWTVMSVFGVRVVVCILEAFRLASLTKYLSSVDKPWYNVTPSTWSQMVLFASLVTVCIPCLRPFLSSLESGLLDSSMLTHLNKGTGSGNSYALHSFNSGRNPIVSSKSDDPTPKKARVDSNIVKLPSVKGNYKSNDARRDSLDHHPSNGKPSYGHRARGNSATLVVGGRNANGGHRSGGGGSGSSTRGLTKPDSTRDEEEGIIRQTTGFEVTVEERDQRNGF
jgi:uncharacterized membrane protein YgcG